VEVSEGACLWPPNHKFYSIENFLGSDDYVWATSSDCSITSRRVQKCTQTESDSTNDTTNCKYVTEDDILCLLAERSGSSQSGRKYDITLDFQFLFLMMLEEVHQNPVIQVEMVIVIRIYQYLHSLLPLYIMEKLRLMNYLQCIVRRKSLLLVVLIIL